MSEDQGLKWDAESAAKMQKIVKDTGLQAASRETGINFNSVDDLLDKEHIAREAIKRNIAGNESR